MPLSEAYRPGLLSSLLLGGGGGRAGGEGETIPSSAVCDGTVNNDETITGGAAGASDQQHDESTTPAQTHRASKKSSKKKKRKSKENDAIKEEGVEGEVAVSSTGTGGEAEVVPVVRDEGLASLFSNENLKRFKRRERTDKEADEAEVRRHTTVLFSGLVYNVACMQRMVLCGRSD